MSRRVSEPPVRPAGSLPLARIDGIEIEIHWTFALLIAVVIWLESPGGRRAVLLGLAWVLAVFASVVVHEFAHSILARRRGARVLGILLLPIGGMSRLEKLPDAPRDELAVAAIGPATSLLLALALGAVGFLTGARVWPPALTTGSWLVRLGWLNVLLGLFNLLPALPMDGGRILRASLALHHDRRWATEIAARTARALAIAMFVVGFLWDIWLALIAVFVFLGAGAEAQQSTREENGDAEGRPTTHDRP